MRDDSDITSDDTSGSNSNGKDRKFVISEKNLVSLFCTCKTPNCNKPLMSNPTITVTGFAVVLTTECVDGHSFVWHSQPKIGCVYECNSYPVRKKFSHQGIKARLHLATEEEVTFFLNLHYENPKCMVKLSVVSNKTNLQIQLLKYNWTDNSKIILISNNCLLFIELFN